jgi:hypothetical protein
MSAPCNHDTMIPVYLHAGGELVLTFEGHHLGVESHVCSECGVIQLQVKHPRLFTAFLEESSAERKQR